MNKTMCGIGRNEFLTAPLGSMSGGAKFVFLDRRLSRTVNEFGISIYTPGEQRREISGRAYDNYIHDLIAAGLYEYDEQTRELLDVGYLSVNPAGSSNLKIIKSDSLRKRVVELRQEPPAKRSKVFLFPTNFVTRNGRRKATPEQILVLGAMYLTADLAGILRDVDPSEIGLAVSMPYHTVEVEIEALIRKKIVMRDKKVGEYWLVDYFTFGRFPGDRGKGAARCIDQVNSQKIGSAMDRAIPRDLAAICGAHINTEKIIINQSHRNKLSEAKLSESKRSEGQELGSYSDGDGALAAAREGGLGAHTDQLESLDPKVIWEILRLKRRADERPNSRIAQDSDNIIKIIRISAALPTDQLLPVLMRASFPSSAVKELQTVLNVQARAVAEQNAKDAATQSREAGIASNQTRIREKKSIVELYQALSNERRGQWEKDFESSLCDWERPFWRSSGISAVALQNRIFKSLQLVTQELPTL